MSSTYRYLPDTKQDQEEMLDFLQLSSIDDLFEDIPAEHSSTRGAKYPTSSSRTTSSEENESACY